VFRPSDVGAAVSRRRARLTEESDEIGMLHYSGVEQLHVVSLERELAQLNVDLSVHL
jgi:hypothetical protein